MELCPEERKKSCTYMRLRGGCDDIDDCEGELGTCKCQQVAIDHIEGLKLNELKLKHKIHELRKKEIAFLATLSKADEKWAAVEKAFVQKISESEKITDHLETERKQWKDMYEQLNTEKKSETREQMTECIQEDLTKCETINKELDSSCACAVNMLNNNLTPAYQEAVKCELMREVFILEKQIIEISDVLLKQKVRVDEQNMLLQEQVVKKDLVLESLQNQLKTQSLFNASEDCTKVKQIGKKCKCTHKQPGKKSEVKFCCDKKLEIPKTELPVIKTCECSTKENSDLMKRLDEIKSRHQNLKAQIDLKPIVESDIRNPNLNQTLSSKACTCNTLDETSCSIPSAPAELSTSTEPSPVSETNQTSSSLPINESTAPKNIVETARTSKTEGKKTSPHKNAGIKQEENAKNNEKNTPVAEKENKQKISNEVNKPKVENGSKDIKPTEINKPKGEKADKIKSKGDNKSQNQKGDKQVISKEDNKSKDEKGDKQVISKVDHKPKDGKGDKQVISKEDHNPKDSKGYKQITPKENNKPKDKKEDKTITPKEVKTIQVEKRDKQVKTKISPKDGKTVKKNSKPIDTNSKNNVCPPLNLKDNGCYKTELESNICQMLVDSLNCCLNKCLVDICSQQCCYEYYCNTCD